MKTRFFPFFIVVAVPVLAFLVGSGRALTAEISSTSQLQTIITVAKTNDANGDLGFTDDETTTAANPLSAEYKLEITSNVTEVVTITNVVDTHHNLSGSGCASLTGTQLAGGGSTSCTFSGTFNDDNDIITNTASVTVGDGVSPPVTLTDTTTVRTIDILPNVTVDKTNDADGDGTFSDEETAPPGATVTFEVAIANETAEAVTIDSIVDSIHGADSELTSTKTPQCADAIGNSVAGSGTITCYFDGVIDDDDALTETNVVTVTVSDDDGNTDDFTDDSTVLVSDIIPAITVVKENDADGDGTYSDVEQVPVGQNSVTFRLTISNDTPEEVTIDSIVDDVHSAPLTTNSPGLTSCADLIGTPLAGEEEVTCYFDGTIDTGVAFELNTVTVTVSDDDGNNGSDEDTSTVRVPRLAVSKTPDSQMILIGGNATFTISVTNTGGVALTGVAVSDPEAPDCNHSFGTLDPGASGSHTCTKADVIADFTNEVTASGQDTLGGVVEATDTAVVDVINPGITITKSPNMQEIPSGGNAQFTITVENTGDVALTSVSVSDPQAPGCNQDIGTLAAGAEVTYDCTRNNVVEDFLNEATASGQHPLGGNVQASDTAFVDVNDPNIAIFKNPAVQTVPQGGTATFSIVVINTGAVNLTNVQVVDHFTPDCNRTISSLAAGDDFDYTCKATNVQNSFTNVATVTGINPASGNPVGDSASADVVVLDATVTVQATPTSLPAPGGIVQYSVTVRNEGSQSVTLTRLNSNRFGVLSNPANSNVQNNTCAFTAPPTVNANGGVFSCTFRAVEEPRSPGSYQLTVTAVFNNGAGTASGNTTLTITQPPTFHLYLPMMVNRLAVGEPNNTACQSYAIGVNQVFHFLADDQTDWYRFILPTAGSVVVELRNFVPRSGQLLVYRDGSGCDTLTNDELIGHNGDFSTTKIINLGQRPAGQYFIRVINDGVLNSNDPYHLQVIFNGQ